MYIAVDIGGTSTKMGELETLDSSSFKTLPSFSTLSNYKNQLKQIFGVIDGLDRSSIQGIGISIGAQVSRDGTQVFASSNLPDYVGRSIVSDLEQRYGCAVRMAHDCVCGLLAEKRFGGLSSFDRVAYITLSTGTGAAVQLRQGNNAITFSNEMGHQVVEPDGFRCLCGQIGCLETITGGKQIELRYGKPASRIQDPKFWERFTYFLAIGIVNLSWLTRIETAAISGGIALYNPYVKDNLQSLIDKLWIGEERQRFLLHWSSLAEDSPLVGATLLHTIEPETILH